MSKLYKELKYDTDYVMQPGDPLTSPDGNNRVQVNDNGTASIITGTQYEFTLTVPEIQGASFRVRIGKSNSTADGYSKLILSITGIENAVADQYGGAGYSINGEYAGEIAVLMTDASFADVGQPLPDSSKRIPIFGGFYVNFYVRSLGRTSSWCDWSNLSSATEIDEQTISTSGHKHTASDINYGQLAVTFGGTGKASHTINSVLIGGTTTTGALQNVASAKGAFYSNGANIKPQFGTLGVDMGGTGTTSFPQNAIVTGNATSSGAGDLTSVSTAAGALYATGANSKATFGTLPALYGGTGVNGSSQAINKVLASPASGSAGVISFRSLTVADLPTGTTSSTVALGNHTHSDYVSKSTTSVQTIASSVRLSGGKGLSVGYGESNGGYVYMEGTSTSGGAAYIDIIKGGELEGIEITNNSLIYTTDGFDTDSTLVFPAASSTPKTIATTDQLLQIGTTATTAAAGNHTLSGYAASSHNHAAGNITSGTLAIARGGTGADGSSITKNYVFAAPSASNGAVSFRALTVADLPTGNTASTVALGNHTHSDYVSKTATGNSQAIKTGLSIATDKSISLGGETGKGNIVLSSATNAANTYISVGSTDGEYIYIEKDKFGYTSDGEQTASILKFPPPSTDVKTIATTDHTHSDYVSKSETSSQSLSGSLSFPAMQQAYFGSQNSAYAWVWDAGFGVGVGSTDHTGIQHDKITHTVSSDTVNLTFPSSAKSGDIATEYDIRKRTRVLYESVIGDSSTPATAVTISEDYNIYHFWIGANGTFPTFTFSFPNFESIPARFPFTLIAHVNSGASTLTGPSGWAWTSGAGLPTSGFAGKVLWISGFKKTNDSTEVPLVSCWRCA